MLPCFAPCNTLKQGSDVLLKLVSTVDAQGVKLHQTCSTALQLVLMLPLAVLQMTLPCSPLPALSPVGSHLLVSVYNVSS